MLEKTEGALKIGESRDTGNIGYTRPIQDKDHQNKKTIQHNTTQKR
jgi:hypothetical protein